MTWIAFKPVKLTIVAPDGFTVEQEATTNNIGEFTVDIGTHKKGNYTIYAHYLGVEEMLHPSEATVIILAVEELTETKLEMTAPETVVPVGTNVVVSAKLTVEFPPV